MSFIGVICLLWTLKFCNRTLDADFDFFRGHIVKYFITAVSCCSFMSLSVEQLLLQSVLLANINLRQRYRHQFFSRVSIARTCQC